MSYSSYQSVGRNASVLNFLVTIVLAILFFIYFSITAYTKDMVWFFPVFDAKPAAGIIRCYGEQVTLKENSEHLRAIADLVNEQISGNKRWDVLNLTDQTYQDYQASNKTMILELFYDEPQRIHSHSPFFSGFDSIIIPIDGRHSDTNILFSLIRGRPSGGSFHVETFEPLKSYIENNSLCTKN